MIRLLQRTSLLFLLMTAAVIAVALVGHAQPTPSTITDLHLDECELPCWLGIVPKVTPVSEAKSLVYRAFGSNPDLYITEAEMIHTLFVWNSAHERLLTIEMQVNKSAIDSLRIDIHQNYPSVGELYAYLPPLRYANFGGYWWIPFMDWSLHGTDTSTACYSKSLRMSDPTYALSLGEDNSYVAASAFVEAWRGFGCHQ
ncbi:MAG: hypothetical protein KF716_31170 [Anaerolineae bacterium]|nr:hypothetical protein [Anaerolineae bacterium]